jgi:hypothetical protein
MRRMLLWSSLLVVSQPGGGPSPLGEKVVRRTG